MSYRPNALGCFSPTGCVCLLELPLYHAYPSRSDASSQNPYLVVVPARHAFSHSASVGKREISSIALSSGNAKFCRLLARTLKIKVGSLKRKDGSYNLSLQLLEIFGGPAAGQFHFAAFTFRGFLTHPRTSDFFPLPIDKHTRGARGIVITW